MASKKFETVFAEGKYHLQKRFARGRRPDIPEASADYIIYRLFDSKLKRGLVDLTCMIPGKFDVPNLHPIGRIYSHGHIFYFPRLFALARKDLRKDNPLADLVGSRPTDKVRRYFERLDATKNDGTGFWHFPEKFPK